MPKRSSTEPGLRLRSTAGGRSMSAPKRVRGVRVGPRASRLLGGRLWASFSSGCNRKVKKERPGGKVRVFDLSALCPLPLLVESIFE